MKELMQKVQARLRDQISYVRDLDIFITPHINFLPAGVNFPAIGIKDGDIDYTDLMGGDLRDWELGLTLIPWVTMFDPEGCITGKGSDKGILDVAGDIHAALDDNFLDIQGMQDVDSGQEKESESFGLPGDGIQRKILKFKYEIRR